MAGDLTSSQWRVGETRELRVLGERFRVTRRDEAVHDASWVDRPDRGFTTRRGGDDLGPLTESECEAAIGEYVELVRSGALD